MSDLRSQLIRLAYTNPSLQDRLLPLLKEAMEHDTDDALKLYLDEHPDADPKNHRVKDTGDSAPSKDEDKGEGKPKAKGMVKSTKALLNKLKGVSAQMKDSVQNAPSKVQGILSDPKMRKEALSSLAETAKASPNKIAKRILDSAKKELKELAHAGKAIRKVLSKPPQKWDKKDRKALYAAGAYVAGAAFAAAGGGPIVVAGALGKSFALHVGIKAVHEMMDAGFLHFEWAETALHAVHTIMAADEDEAVQKALIEQLTAATIKVMDKGLTDKDIENILTETHPGPDTIKEPKVIRKDPSKKG